MSKNMTYGRGKASEKRLHVILSDADDALMSQLELAAVSRLRPLGITKVTKTQVFGLALRALAREYGLDVQE